jgi:ATP/maltotriose-dependent transcriptional regulator MalT
MKARQSIRALSKNRQALVSGTIAELRSAAKWPWRNEESEWLYCHRCTELAYLFLVHSFPGEERQHVRVAMTADLTTVFLMLAEDRGRDGVMAQVLLLKAHELSMDESSYGLDVEIAKLLLDEAERAGRAANRRDKRDMKRTARHIDLDTVVSESVAPDQDYDVIIGTLGDLLTDSERAFLQLEAFSGLSDSEMAECLHISEGAVRTRRSRTQAKLKKHLEVDVPV